MATSLPRSFMSLPTVIAGFAAPHLAVAAQMYDASGQGSDLDPSSDLFVKLLLDSADALDRSLKLIAASV